MATMNVSLPDPMKSWVDAQTKGGRYSNASDYVRDLIRKDQDRQQAVAELQQLITEGIESGEPKEFDFAAFLKRKRKDYNERNP
jgi:antitoxin ParD1/3/4